MKKFIYLFLAATILYGCPVKPKKLEKVQIVPDKYTLFELGEKKQLTVVFTPSDYVVQGTITWNSDNPDAITVSSAGVVEALDYGSATITVTVDGESAKCLIRVQSYPEACEFHKWGWYGFDAPDVIDVDAYTEDGIDYEDTLAITGIALLGTDVDYTSAGYMTGSGAVAWVEAVILQSTPKTGPDAEKGAVYILGTYVPTTVFATSITDWVTNFMTPNKKFMKGSFDVAGLNAAFKAHHTGDPPIPMDNYFTGSVLLFLNPDGAPSGLYYYGTFEKDEFVLDKNRAIPSYNLTGKIMLWLYEVGDEKELWYIDDSFTMWIKHETADNEDLIKLVTLEPWIKDSGSSAPAKSPYKFGTPKENVKIVRVAPRTKPTKLDRVDMSKLKVFDLNKTVLK